MVARDYMMMQTSELAALVDSSLRTLQALRMACKEQPDEEDLDATNNLDSSTDAVRAAESPLSAGHMSCAVAPALSTAAAAGLESFYSAIDDHGDTTTDASSDTDMYLQDWDFEEAEEEEVGDDFAPSGIQAEIESELTATLARRVESCHKWQQIKAGLNSSVNAEEAPASSKGRAVSPPITPTTPLFNGNGFRLQ